MNELTDSQLNVLIKLDKQAAATLYNAGEKKIWMSLSYQLHVLQTLYNTPLTLKQLQFCYFPPFLINNYAPKTT